MRKISDISCLVGVPLQGQECGAHLGDWSLAERYAESFLTF